MMFPRAMAFALVVAAGVMSIVAAENAASQVWVNPTGGVDNATTHDGSQSKPFKSLGFALAHVDTMGQVHLEAGHYTGDENFPTITRNVSILAYPLPTDVHDASKVVFDAEGKEHGFVFDENVQASVIGITVTRAVDAVDIKSGRVELRFCALSDNTVGVYVRAGAAAISGCLLSDNTIGVSTTSTTFLTGTNITASSRAALGIYSTAGDLHLSSCWLTELQTAVEAAGVGEYSITADDSEFNNNAHGLIAHDNTKARASIQLDACTFDKNGGVNETGGAILAGKNVDVQLTRTILTSNRVSSVSASYGKGGAIYCAAGASFTITDSEVEFNEARDGGAGYCEKGCKLSVNNATVIQGNTQAQNTGACPDLKPTTEM